MYTAWIRTASAIGLCCLLSPCAQGQTIGSSMVTFLEGKVGQRIGGAESSHAAFEALRVYRPVDREDTLNVWKFTVVNNSPSGQIYDVNVGTSTIDTVSATSANTAGSYGVFKVESPGTVPDVSVGDAYIYVENAKANEISGSPGELTQLGQ
jgi:hypothetical protein